MRRGLLFVAVCAAVATALSGCTGIPFASGVNKGVPVQDETNADIQFLPAGPAVDATPEQILRGFVEASTSPSGDTVIAGLIQDDSDHGGDAGVIFDDKNLWCHAHLLNDFVRTVLLAQTSATSGENLR